MSILHFTLACCCEPEVGVFTVSSSTIHNLSATQSFMSQACLLFCEPFLCFPIPLAPLVPLLHTITVCCVILTSVPHDMNYFIHVRLALNRALCSFCSLLYSHCSLLFSCFSLLLASTLRSSLIVLFQPPKLFSLCPQCLGSVLKVSFPAQMAVALRGAGSAMGTTTVPMVQMRYQSNHFLFD